MEALMNSTNPIASGSKSKSGANKKRSALPHQKVSRGPHKESIDASLHSILPSTRLPPSLHSTSSARPSSSLGRIPDKKLRAKLASQQLATERGREEREDVREYLQEGEAGGIEVDTEEGERTWRVAQKEILEEVGEGSKGKRFDLKMQNIGGGGFKVAYTRNGRHLALASNHGHISTMDWQAGRLHSELQLGESCRDIKFLHSEAFYAVAQKKYVFIYDQFGTEIHKLKQHLDVTKMEFLPYHYLLATSGNAGHLKYHDTSTGLIVASHRTHLGPTLSMAQNPHSAILSLGHSPGTVTFWSPNLSTPHVKLLAHLGPVQSIAIDPSAGSAGRYMATAGADGRVKVWDCRNWGKCLREWGDRRAGGKELAYSQNGMLAVGGRGGVTVYRDLYRSSAHTPTPYLDLALPSLTPTSLAFCPFEDLLGIGHQSGFSSFLVPGSGEAQFDSNVADVFESHNRRREREVRGVLEKIQPDLITMDTEFLGKLGEGVREEGGEKEKAFRKMGRLDRLRAEGKADEGEMEVDGEDGEEEEGEGGKKMSQGAKRRAKEKEEKKKMRGKGKGLKRYLRKKRKNVVDPAMIAIKEKLEKQKIKRELDKKVERGEAVIETGALGRFS